MQAQPGWVDIAVVHNWEGRGRWGARGRVWDGVKGEWSFAMNGLNFVGLLPEKLR